MNPAHGALRFRIRSTCVPVLVTTLAVIGLAAIAGGCASSYRPPVVAVNAPDLHGPATSPAPVDEPPTPDTRRGVYHVVQRGQTMWRIARTYGVGVDQLASANSISDPANLTVGSSLLIPGAMAKLEVPAYPTTAASPAKYSSTVPRGDWLWPVSGGRILSYYGAPRKTHRHQGVDILGVHGSRVVASSSGRVVYSGDSMRGYGKTVIVDHGGGFRTLYAHNSRLLVREGQRVKRGQAIARVGQSGNASTDHCHFEIRRNDKAVDPLRYVVPSIEARP
jgi:murein DD-endopeptidase MepM/ murein hydrolase activator NlpD